MFTRAIILSIVLFSTVTYTLNSTDIKVCQIHSSELTQDSIEDLKTIFMDAFYSVYIKDWTPILEQQTHFVFDNYIKQLQDTPEMILITALKNDQIVGWALFKKENSKSTILEILCISPSCWRQGIGKKLTFSICDIYPSINHICLMTRKINPISPSFYEALGFKKTNFTLEEYRDFDFESLLGYEWHKEE
jgi:ribosomal protein S18 acetylase RimI-like enzyme